MTLMLTRRHAAGGLAGALAAPMIGGNARAQPVKLILSHHLPTSHLVHITTENFARYVAEGTKGQVTVDIKPSSQMFNLRTSAEALQLGTLDMCWSDLGTLGNWQPQFGFVSLPFLFNDYDHVKRVMYGKVGEQVSADVKAGLGIEVLCLGASGFRVFLGRKEIKSAADCRGIKLRVPEIPTWVEMARALGANPTPIPAGEIYTALQTGVVDAMEAPADFIVSSKLFEVGPMSTRTHHIFTEASMFASAKRMAALGAEQQAVIRDSARRAVGTEMWEANLKEQLSAWATLAEKTKSTANPDIASFREKTKPMLDSFASRNGAKAKAYIEGTAAAA